MTKDLSVKEAARRLGVSTSTINSWIDQGFFPQAYKLNPMVKNSPYRIPESDIVALEKKRHAG